MIQDSAFDTRFQQLRMDREAGIMQAGAVAMALEQQAGKNMPRRSPDHGTGSEFERVHARLLLHFPELVDEIGGDPRFLDRVGLDPGRCRVAGEATYRQWIAAMELAATELGVPDFGMRLALRQGGAGVHGPLGEVMRNSRTLGEALSYVVTHNAAHSLAARVWKGKTITGQHVFFGHDILVEDVPSRRQAIEQILLLGQLGARLITGERASGRRIHFRHREISSIDTYRRNFGCEVLFCRNEDGIVFRAEDMDCPIHNADADAFAHARSFIESSYAKARAPLPAQVRGVVMQQLWTTECSAEKVAAALAMHPRTLHRRLAREGVSFQQIKDEVRRDYMVYYLQQTDLELARISEKLGFSEQSTLSHFARQMLDASPSELRAQARGNASVSG